MVHFLYMTGQLPETEIWKMHTHHDAARFTSHENIEKWNPFQAWAENILRKEGIGEVVLTGCTVLLYLLVFISLFNGMETRTVTGF